MYFVHSFRALPSKDNEDWVLATTDYGSEFVSVVERGNVSATQFHPEKSGQAGLDVLRAFLEGKNSQNPVPASQGAPLLTHTYPDMNRLNLVDANWRHWSQLAQFSMELY